MKKKMISLFLCGMMAVTAIVGCGGSGETKSEESGSEVVEIEFWYGLGGKLGETMESIINDFNETQDEVKVTGVQQSDYAETKRLVQSAIASGKVPATVLFTNQYLQQFAEKGTLEYLDSYIENAPEFHKEDLVESLMDYCQDADGRIFGLPVYGTTQVMYYDKAVFEENGIDPDEAFANWQNLAEAAEKITVKENGETVFYGWEPMYGVENLKDIAFSNGGKVLSDDGKTVLIDSPEWVESWEAIRKWIHDDQIMGIHSGGDGWEFWYKTIDDVMQGRAGGYIGSNGDQGDLDFDKLAAHIQPGFGDHAPSPVADPITCAILSKASDEQKEAGFKWISYLTSVQGTAKFAMNTGYTPVRTAALEDEAFQAYLEENPQARVPLEQLEYAQRNFSDPTNGKIDQALKDAADMVEIENIPAEEALRIAKETAQKALDQYWASK